MERTSSSRVVFLLTAAVALVLMSAPAALAQIDQWLAMMRDALTANYDRLDHVLAEMNPQPPQPNKPPKET